MSRTIAAIILGLCVALAAGEPVRYDNYRVYKLNARTLDALAALKSIEGSSDSLIFLNEVQKLDDDINVVVAPHKVPDFVKSLVASSVEYKLVETDAQARLDAMDVQISPQTRAGVYDWTSYHNLEETYSWLDSLAAEYPDVVTVIVGGQTYEGRDIKGVKISHKAGNSGIFIEGGIHAREWISPATVTYITNQLLTSKTPAIQDLAQNYDWYIFPHVNPDGFVYTYTNSRMWRKTRSQQERGCWGTDANRNWGYHWMEVGASSTPCSDTFGGPKAFSEVETETLSEYIKSLKGKIQLYISFHSYSQLLLYPYGNTAQLPPNNADLKRIFEVATSAVGRRYGTRYNGGNVYTAIYPAAGSSTDWAYGDQDIKLAYCYELRPSSNNAWTGFNLPAVQIIPTGEETVDSVVAMVNESKRLNYLK